MLGAKGWVLGVGPWILTLLDLVPGASLGNTFVPNRFHTSDPSVHFLLRTLPSSAAGRSIVPGISFRHANSSGVVTMMSAGILNW